MYLSFVYKGTILAYAMYIYIVAILDQMPYFYIYVKSSFALLSIFLNIVVQQIGNYLKSSKLDKLNCRKLYLTLKIQKTLIFIKKRQLQKFNNILFTFEDVLFFDYIFTRLLHECRSKF